MATARNKASKKTETTAADEAAEMAALEAVLRGDGDTEMEIDDSRFEDVDQGALADALKADEAKEKAYKDQKSKIDTNDDEEVEAASKSSSKTVEKKAKAATPNATRDAELFAKEVLSILGENAVLDSEEGELTDEQLMDAMKEVTQIKVREKALNLCNHIMSGRALNRYTQIASDILVKAQLDGCKPVTFAEIKAGYETAGYKKGTVDAQAGQLMALFRSMGMAKSGGKGVLTPNENSVFLDALASS